MAKKRKRKRKKTTKPTKPTKTPKRSSNVAPPGGLKISEAILNLCEPLRRRYQEPSQIRGIISITVTAWNISLFPESERAYQEEMIVKILPRQLIGEDIALFLDNIDALIKLKKKYYPNVREYILEHKVSFSGDSYTLVVGVTTVPEKIRRKRS